MKAKSNGHFSAKKNIAKSIIVYSSFFTALCKSVAFSLSKIHIWFLWISHTHTRAHKYTLWFAALRTLSRALSLSLYLSLLLKSFNNHFARTFEMLSFFLFLVFHFCISFFFIFVLPIQSLMTFCFRFVIASCYTYWLVLLSMSLLLLVLLLPYRFCLYLARHTTCGEWRIALAGVNLFLH